ncbi:type IV conjugative transfer system lipoprotein TraV [Azomonas macrocytogenes]
MQKVVLLPFLGNSACQFFSRKALRLIPLMALVCASSGCSLFDLGSRDYGCKGLPKGVQCMSARDVYAATNDGQVPRSTQDEEEEKDKDKDKDKKKRKKQSSQQTRSVSEQLIDNYVAPRLPDRPIPIRTPAQVMRIWVAPWEDTNGDLNATGYVYTEIEPRRWVIGDGVPAEAPVIRPLQQLDPSPDRQRNQPQAASSIHP